MICDYWRDMKAKKYFHIGILLSPVDSLPIFQGISMYAPYLAVLSFFIFYLKSNKCLHELKYGTIPFLIALFITFTLIYSFYKGLFIYHDFKGFYNYSVQLVIAIILYKSFNCYFESLSDSYYIETFADCFIKYSLPIILIGILEIILLPFKNLYSSIMSVFSWRFTDRLQLVSGEPAWASRFILSFISFIPLANFKRHKKDYLLIISLLILLFTGSTLGIICVLVYFITAYVTKKNILYCCLIILFGLLVTPIIYNNLNDYTKSRIELLSKLDSSDVETLAVNAGSGSVMARLGNPVLAVSMGNDNFLLGVGGGYYYINHYKYMNRVFPNALFIKNIYETGTTPKNLFARIYAETGIIGISIVILALIWLYNNKIHNNLLRGIYITMILLTLNFDSLFHIYPLLLFCFLLNIPTRNKITICAEH